MEGEVGMDSAAAAAAAQMEKHSSAAAFVEGGVQDACDDACSICLEAFSDSEPSAVTSCRHEFHLQCILEWCQRSSQCPMCWQAISMKDPMSQELLEAVEEERNAQENHARTTTIFRHPLLGDFEVLTFRVMALACMPAAYMQKDWVLNSYTVTDAMFLPFHPFQVPVDADEAEIEERIIQHLAAAAAIRRSHRHARREGRRSRSAAHGHGHQQQQVLFFPAAAEATPSGSLPSHPRQEGDHQHASALVSSRPPLPTVQDSAEETAADTSVNHTTSSSVNNGPPVGSNDSVSRNQSSPVNQDEAGPSDAQSFSDTFKSRLQSVSTKYKDSITKSTRGWKERWFAQNSTISNLGSDMRREVNAGIAAVSRMMEKLETRDGTTGPSSATAALHPGSDTDSQGAVVPPTAATALHNASSSSAA